MEQRKNLCAQVPISLHNRVTEAKEALGQTTAEYITNLLTEYYEMKENGGNTAMTNGKNRTMAFQIDEELFQRIKTHLDRESARLGRKVTQREFVLRIRWQRWRWQAQICQQTRYLRPQRPRLQGRHHRQR